MDVKGGSGNGDGCGEIGEHICKMGEGGDVCQGNLHQHIRPIVFGFFRFGFGMEMDVEAKKEMEMDAEMEVGGTHHCVTIEA